MHTHFIFFPRVYLKLVYVINVEQSEQDMKQEPLEWAWVGHRCKAFRSTRCLLTFVSKGTAWSPSPSRCVAIHRGRDQSLDGFSWRFEVMPAAAPAASLRLFQPGSGTNISSQPWGVHILVSVKPRLDVNLDRGEAASYNWALPLFCIRVTKRKKNIHVLFIHKVQKICRPRCKFSPEHLTLQFISGLWSHVTFSFSPSSLSLIPSSDPSIPGFTVSPPEAGQIDRSVERCRKGTRGYLGVQVI